MKCCSVEGCRRSQQARGYCGVHYGRWRRHGDVLTQVRKSPCKWISRDETGRPTCVHGRAVKRGQHWTCSESNRLARTCRAGSENRRRRKRFAEDAEYRTLRLAQNQNDKRIMIGGTYLGTESRFPVPRETVVRFAQDLITQHRADNPRKSVDALAEA